MATGFQLWQDIETAAGVNRVETPWPDPQFVGPYGAIYSLADVIDCMEGRLDEPKNSGRRVAVAIEVEIALKAVLGTRRCSGRFTLNRQISGT